MKRKNLFLLIIVLPVIIGSTISFKEKKSSEDSIIFWKSNIKLRWDNFSGIPDTLSKYKALTYSTVEVIPTIMDDMIEYQIKCFFEKNLSWSKNKKSQTLLKHEQLHFDISELATRILRKKISNQLSTDLKTTKEVIKTFFNEEENERFFLNQKYDSETNHGTIESNQKQWDVYIASELKKLEKYASTQVVIKRVKS